jgi:hypothetical protein
MNHGQYVITSHSFQHKNFHQRGYCGNYAIFTGPGSEYEWVQTDRMEIHLLGSLFDWQNTSAGNLEIIQNATKKNTVEEILTYIDQCCGHFVLLIRFDNNIYLLHDAAGQKEIYYDTSITTFASQPNLIAKVITPEPHSDPDAIDYYQSSHFQRDKLFIGETTHWQNIKHLLPNHRISIHNRRLERFFPTIALPIATANEIVPKVAAMLRGFIHSLANRYQCKLAVTAGYDSRVLFLASLGIPCEYYVAKHHNMGDTHHDITIPTKLTSIYQKPFSVLEGRQKKTKFTKEQNDRQLHDLDYPRLLYGGEMEPGIVHINGNISEIARNYYGYHRKANASDLSYLSGHSTHPFPVQVYKIWLQQRRLFTEMGYHYLDLYYWEQKMGIWAAKGKSESTALGKMVISPFNSRSVLTLLLSSPRSHRDSHFNKLYNELIRQLSNGHPEVIALPVNPDRKQDTIRAMKRFKVYNLYRHIGVKTRRLLG